MAGDKSVAPQPLYYSPLPPSPNVKADLIDTKTRMEFAAEWM